ncbi:MAG: hypothetical protein EBU88_20095, partial [Acidobacteria bacterium]|nr:hypothetical protein [Acidobacteriota bacterium]
PLAGSFVLMLTKLTFLLHEQSKHAKAQAKEQLPEAQKLRATMKKLIKAITQLAHCDQCLLVVEDLDRVRPDYAVALLEALYHLFLPWPHDNQADADLPLSSIWAVNMNMLEEYLYEHYRHQPSFDPTAYLTKIFHTRVNVPPLFLRDGPDDASPTCLWRETLGRVQKKQGLGAELFDNTKPERLADQFSRELNYAFMGNLRLHEAIRNKCLAYWSHDHSDCPPSRECRSNRILWDRVAQPQRFHEARLLTLVEAFPGFRETVVLPTGMWPEFVNRLNSRRQQVQLETTANPIYRHIDDPSLITLLLDLKVLVYDQHADRYRPNHEQCVCLRQDLMQLLDHGF